MSINKKILIIKNISHEGPGLFENILKEKNIQYEIIDLNRGEQFPNAENFLAVIILGGPDSANNQTPKIQRELKFIKNTVALSIPYFGICLGMQLLVKAVDGEVLKCSQKEIGWRDPEGNFFDVSLTEEGTNDPLFQDVKTPLNIFHLHGETVNLIKEIKLLGTGRLCKNQIIKVGNNAYGIQGHFELIPKMYTEWLSYDSDLKILDHNLLMSDYNLIRQHYEQNSTIIFNNFLKIAGASLNHD